MFSCTLSGTTCTIAVIIGKECIVAHVGDSRSVLATIKEGKLCASDLTKDHHPDLASERERVEQCGGEIKKLDEKSPYRVFWKNSMIPGLAMTRAIGDIVCQNLGVISDPDIFTFTVSSNDKYLLICSDGVWEFISSEQAVAIISSIPKQSLAEAAEALCKHAYDLWIENEKEVSDDITCMLVSLQS